MIHYGNEKTCDRQDFIPGKGDFFVREEFTHKTPGRMHKFSGEMEFFIKGCLVVKKPKRLHRSTRTYCLPPRQLSLRTHFQSFIHSFFCIAFRREVTTNDSSSFEASLSEFSYISHDKGGFFRSIYDQAQKFSSFKIEIRHLDCRKRTSFI